MIITPIINTPTYTIPLYERIRYPYTSVYDTHMRAYTLAVMRHLFCCLPFKRKGQVFLAPVLFDVRY
jgi:hypothetical protein